MSADTPPNDDAGAPLDPVTERRVSVWRALERHAAKLARKVEGLQGDLAEAKRGPEYQRMSDALYAYMGQVPARAGRVQLPDPHDPSATLDIELDPMVAASANAVRYAKRAAKCERGLAEIPPRLKAVEREQRDLGTLIEAARTAHESAVAVTPGDAAGAALAEAAEAAHLALERVLASLSQSTRMGLHAPEPLPKRRLGLSSDAAPAGGGPKSPTTAAVTPQGKRPRCRASSCRGGSRVARAGTC